MGQQQVSGDCGTGSEVEENVNDEYLDLGILVPWCIELLLPVLQFQLEAHVITSVLLLLDQQQHFPT